MAAPIFVGHREPLTVETGGHQPLQGIARVVQGEPTVAAAQGNNRPVLVVPTLAPMITPMAAGSESSPPLKKAGGGDGRGARRLYQGRQHQTGDYDFHRTGCGPLQRAA